MNPNHFAFNPSLSLTESSTTEILLESAEADIEVSLSHPILAREPTNARAPKRGKQKHSSLTSIQIETAPSTHWHWPRSPPTNNREQQTLLATKGYKIVKKISDTLQGEIYKAKVTKVRRSPSIAPKPTLGSHVAIKRTDKYLFHRQITIEDGASLCIKENIIKEALILKYLTIDNTPIGNYVVKFIDFFESHFSYYLVMEYVESEMNLKQFIYKARVYINNNQLSILEYHRIVRYLLWQLCVTIVWCHKAQCTAHLDLCSENIMLQNVQFIENKYTHTVSINTKISIKVCDFGASEVFERVENDMFSCSKDGLSIYNECYLAPDVFNGYEYDARYADNWCLGIILFECMTAGKQLYFPQTMYEYKSGYRSLHNNDLKSYLISNNLMKYFDFDSFSLLQSLLNVNPSLRLNGMKIIQHKWFNIYFKRYAPQINKKFYRQTVKMDDRFPFYVM